jgi:hypothetical protein
MAPIGMSVGGFSFHHKPNQETTIMHPHHGKTFEMFIDAGIKGSKLGVASRVNKELAKGATRAVEGLGLPKEIAEHPIVQVLLMLAAPGAMHAFATYYPHLIPESIGSHRVVSGATLAIEAAGKEAVEPALEVVMAAMLPGLKAIAALSGEEVAGGGGKVAGDPSEQDSTSGDFFVEVVHPEQDASG